MYFDIVVDQWDTHVHFRLFVGEKEGALGLAGKLTMREKEFIDFICRPIYVIKPESARQKYLATIKESRRRNEMKIEVRNETNRRLYVRLCESKLSGNLYLHIDNKKSKHINIPVEANYMKTIETEKVED